MNKVAFGTSVIFLLLGATTAFAISYSSIEDNCKNLTTAQYKVYSNELEGQPVQLEGEIIDVEKKFLSSNFNVSVDMNGDSFVDVDFPVDKETAMSLKKGESYKIAGEIKSVEREFGECFISLKKASIN